MSFVCLLYVFCMSYACLLYVFCAAPGNAAGVRMVDGSRRCHPPPFQRASQTGSFSGMQRSETDRRAVVYVFFYIQRRHRCLGTLGTTDRGNLGTPARGRWWHKTVATIVF